MMSRHFGIQTLDTKIMLQCGRTQTVCPVGAFVFPQVTHVWWNPPLTLSLSLSATPSARPRKWQYVYVHNVCTPGFDQCGICAYIITYYWLYLVLFCKLRESAPFLLLTVATSNTNQKHFWWITSWALSTDLQIVCFKECCLVFQCSADNWNVSRAKNNIEIGNKYFRSVKS